MFSTAFIIAAGLRAAGAPVDHQMMETQSDTLRAVTIVADKGMVVSRTDTIGIRSNQDMVEVLQRLPGLGVADYGGAAGLKSVSLRGLGSAHTAIYIDGVKVGNVQSGQADLGGLGIDNFSSAIIDYAQNSVSFNTARPVFRDGHDFSGRVTMHGGSFGTWQPSARLDFRLSDRLAISANAGGISSKGDFEYGTDNTRRVNNDISRWHGGLDAFGNLEGGNYHIKAFYSQSDRGNPGSASWPSETDRQNDRNAFFQGVLRKSFTSDYSIGLSAKGAYDKLGYTSTWGDSEYKQKEAQLNLSQHFRMNDWMEVSLATGAVFDGLEATAYTADRTNLNAAIASALRVGTLRVDAALEYSGYFDKTKGPDAPSAKDRHNFSPSIDLRWGLSEHLDIVSFARRAYRVPTFNELYYTGYGNPELDPEDAWLTDLGLDWHRALTSRLKASMKLDVFYNSLKDKIISAPSPDDPYMWYPYNIGKVEAKGTDVSAALDYVEGEWTAGLDLHYSWQSALDRTADSYTYGKQVPYIARNTATVAGKAGWRGWNMDAVFNHRSGRCDASGDMPSWNTLDASLAKKVNLQGVSATFCITARNIFDCRYESVRDYPVPGRSFTGGISLNF